MAQSLENEGHTVKIAYGRETVPTQYQKYAVKIGNTYSPKINAAVARVFDNDGFFAYQETKSFLKWAESYDPDIIWLHNLHGYYINVKLLFNWIKSRPNMKVKWTLHDCWAFTGHCAYFSYVGCEKWKYQCEDCEQKKNYPTSFIKDNSYKNFNEKSSIFTGVNDLTIITPSYWLADLVKQSFLKEYPIIVIHNSIDKAVFKPTNSDIKKHLDIEEKFVVLGVAAIWDQRKGLDDFYILASLLSDDYVIVLIGVSDEQIELLPNNIIGVGKTNNQTELAKYYTMADIFFNPTYEDNYPTVNLEAQACGTTVISYDTGGAKETISLSNSTIISQGNIEEACKVIESIRDSYYVKDY